ncbi:MAG: hypothetical protein A2Z16_04150 [Chloroflexi bacterium RBG_16_54_18]|nr:MAG: hypothetical protein A2Z16_04150 [Chloroflexi bacterium RBG_16_54_18]
MSDQTPSSSPPSFGSRLGQAFITFLRVLIRVLLILLLAALLGAGVYFGIPALYRRYVQPVERDLARLNDFQARQEQADLRFSRRLDDLQQRLEEIELHNDTQKQSLDELQTRIEGMESDRQFGAQTGESAQSTAIARLDDMETSLAEVSANLEQMQAEIAALSQTLAKTSAQVQELSSQTESGAAPLKALRNDLQLVKAMEHLTRSRLFLAQNNLGLVEQDVQDARLLLTDLQGEVPAYQIDALARVIARLDAALSSLPSRPLLAAEDLEVAWQLLQGGLPVEPTTQPTSAPASLPGTPTPSAAP